MSDDYQVAGREPPLEELLADPIMTLLLECDAIEPADLRRYLGSIRDRLQPARAEPAAARAAAA
jgi:hypothetical protein